MTVQATNYDGSKTYNILQDTDIVNELGTGTAKEVLSAYQGVVLRRILGNVSRFYYVSKVIQIPSAESVVDLYTQDELKSLLGVTSDTDFNNKITAFAINGAKNSNSANVVSINYLERDKKMQIKVNTANVGSMRANILIAFSEQG